MILRALFLRPLRRHPIRFAATVLGVAVGVAAVVATVVASRAAVASLADGVAEIAGASTLEISRPGGVDDAILGSLRPLSDDALFAPLIDESARLASREGLVRVLGVDLLVDGEMRKVRIDNGALGARPALEATLDGDGALVSARFARELGVRPGDRLPLLARSREVALTVAGVFEPERFSSVWDRIVLVDVALAQEAFGRAGRLDRVEVRPRAGERADVDALAERIRSVLPPEYRVTRPNDRADETRRMVRALEFNLTALSGISVLVGIVLVATTLATSVVQRRYGIALLRSLGASRGDVARAVLVEAASIGALGGALGVALGHLGARAALAGVRRTVATVVSNAVAGDVVFDPALAAFGFALGLVASLAAAILPLREAQRTPPLQGLRGERPGGDDARAMRPLPRALLLAAILLAAWALTLLPAWDDRPIAALGSALFLLGTLLLTARPLVTLLARLRFGGRAARATVSPLRVAQAALEAGRQRAAWAAGAVGIAVALAISMATMVGSFRTTVIDWSAQAMSSDLFLRPLPNESGVPVGRLDPEIVAAATRLFGPEAVDPYHSASARFRGERVALGGAALEVVGRVGGVPFRDGRSSAEVLSETARRRGAIVDESFARRYGVAEGDRIEIVTPSGPVTREVIGVYVDYGSHLGTIVLARGDFLSLYPDEGATSVAIFLGDGADPAAARARLMDALGGRFAFEAFLNREIREEILNVFDRTFAVTTALQLVASVVAVIAVLTVLFALVRERRKDLGVLRVLGASPGQVRSVVVGEAGLLAAAGSLGGLVVGLAVGYVLVAVVNVQSFGWTLRFLPPWGAIAGTALAVLPAGLLAGLLPAIAAARTTPREVLHEDG